MNLKSGNLIKEERRAGGQEGILEGWMSGGMEVWRFKEERRTECQEGFSEGRKLRGQEVISEGKKLGGQEGRLFNNSSIDEISQQPLTETNHSTVQPFNHSTDNGYTSIHPYLYTSKKAFTLAEVLIALGVIGVIASITLPTVINKTQMTVLKNQYKRVYSNYSNALQRYIIDNDGIPDCTYGGTRIGASCRNFHKMWLNNYFKQTKYCNGNAFNEGCVPKYNKYVDSDSCMGFKEDYINNINKVWILNDGSIYINYSDGSMPIFAVDINGLKGPNKGGYDLFSFAIKKNGNTAILEPSTCIPIEKGGINPNNDFINIYK